MEALRRGDALKARESFERLVAEGRADGNVCVALARACGELGDIPAVHAALDRALALNPLDFRALILKADRFAQAADARAASSFYLAAVRNAPPPNQLPAELREEVTRAQRMCERYAAQFEGFLRGRLLGTAADGPRSGTRFEESLELLFGRKKIYFQQPRYYYFPGLPQIQFYDRAAFPWLDRVEAATRHIRAELLEVLKEPSAFQPYVQGEAGRPRHNASGMLDNPDWGAFYLWKNGAIVPENAERCPRTLEALTDVPLARVEGRSPSVLFSLLRPGCRIPPHNGFVNTRLICHLPLVVPGPCGLRVGNDSRSPVEGKAWVFDDTIEHEAWNSASEPRVILLFEVWRPELTPREREQVSAMFEAIDAYGPGSPAWNI